MKARKIIFIIITMMVAVWRSPWVSAAPQKVEQTFEQIAQAIKSFEALDRSGGEYNVLFHRDPMRTLVDSKGRNINTIGIHHNLVLQGVIRSDDMNAVLVNDQFYSVGDEIGPYRIKQIQPEGLLVEQGEEELFIPLYPELTPDSQTA